MGAQVTGALVILEEPEVKRHLSSGEIPRLKIHDLDDLDVDDAHLARHCGLVTPAYAFHNTSFVRLELEDVCRRWSCMLLQHNLFTLNRYFSCVLLAMLEIPAALSLPQCQGLKRLACQTKWFNFMELLKYYCLQMVSKMSQQKSLNFK